MNTVYVNLPVRDIERSMAFFQSVGFSFNPQLTDDLATCMYVTENVFVMLLREDRFRNYTGKSLCNSRESSEVMMSLSVPSREKVDQMVSAAVAAGGSAVRDPEDHGFMYGRAFSDLDGHLWELVYMNPSILGEGSRS